MRIISKYTSLLVFLLIAFSASAQRDFRIQAQLGNYASPQSINKGFSSEIISNYGVGVQYKMFKNVAVKLSYHKWYDLNGFMASLHGFKQYDVINANVPSGTIEWRLDYYTVSMLALYSKAYKNHEFYAGVGLAYTSGTNDVIISTYQEPGYPDFLIESELRKAAYFGPSWEVGYNYLWMGKHINTGLSLAGSHYPSEFTELNFKINLGYNFSIKKHKKSK